MIQVRVFIIHFIRDE